MKIHSIKGKIQNIFIVEYPSKILILDGACRSDYDVIINYVTGTLQRRIFDIKLIIVSHMHPDHAGAANIFRQKHKIPIAAYYTVDNWYSDICGGIQHVIDIALAWYVVLKSNNKPSRMWYNRKLKANYNLYDNSIIPFFDEWKTVFTPGHTAHDISLYHEKKKILYAADNILELNGKYILPFPIIFREIMLESLKKIENLKIDTLYIAHGKINSDHKANEIIKNVSKTIYNKKKGTFVILQSFVKFTNCARKFKKVYYNG